MTLFFELHFNWESLTSMTYGLLKLAAEKWAEEVMEKNHKRSHSMLCIISGLFFQSSVFLDGGKYFPATQAWPHWVRIYAKFIKSSCRQGWMKGLHCCLSVFQKVLQFTPCSTEWGSFLKSPWIYVKRDKIWALQYKQVWLCMWKAMGVCVSTYLASSGS